MRGTRGLNTSMTMIMVSYGSYAGFQLSFYFAYLILYYQYFLLYHIVMAIFLFAADCSPPEASKCSAVCSRDGRCTGLEDEYRMMTCNEIINGSVSYRSCRCGAFSVLSDFPLDKVFFKYLFCQCFTGMMICFLM